MGEGNFLETDRRTWNNTASDSIKVRVSISSLRKIRAYLKSSSGFSVRSSEVQTRNRLSANFLARGEKKLIRRKCRWYFSMASINGNQGKKQN